MTRSNTAEDIDMDVFNASAVQHMDVLQLRQFISDCGMKAHDCFEKSDLLARAREAEEKIGPAATRIWAATTTISTPVRCSSKPRVPTSLLQYPSTNGNEEHHPITDQPAASISDQLPEVTPCTVDCADSEATLFTEQPKDCTVVAPVQPQESNPAPAAPV